MDNNLSSANPLNSQAHEDALLQCIRNCSVSRFDPKELRKILGLAFSHTPNTVELVEAADANGISRPLLIGPKSSFLLMTRTDLGDREIGRGGYKIAFFAIDLKTAQIKMVMTCQKSTCGPAIWQHQAKEIAIMELLQGIPEIRQFEAALVMEDTSYCVMEFCNAGDLVSILANRTMSLEPRIRLARDIAKGLKEVHARGILHRDLKPQNIFLNQVPGHPLQAKIADFGCACDIDDQEALKEFWSTMHWMSPEKAKLLMTGKSRELLTPDWIKTSSDKVDVWVLGCILFMLLGGGILDWQCVRDPKEEPIEATKRCAKLEQSQLTNEIRHTFIEPEILPILEGMLQVDPSKRFSAEEVYEGLLAVCNARGIV